MPRDPERVCGAKTPHGPCQQWAGAGTSHKGQGNCKRHGGATPNHQVNVEKKQALERMRTYGEPIDTDPHAALLSEINRTAGHVAWLGEVVGGFTGEQELEQKSGEWGYKPAVLVELYQGERQHLARVCKMAIDAGIAERQVRIAESQGALLADILRGIFEKLVLSKEQKEIAAVEVPRALRAVAS